MVNLLLVIPAGATFLHSIDTSGMTKDAQYIAEAVLSGIDKVGNENVLQVITDNAANCKGGWPIIKAKYKHIICSPCAAHTLDLLLEDWGKILWFECTLSDSNKVVVFITGHEGARALLRQHSPDKSLLKPGDTRFGTNSIIIHRLMELKDVLQEMLASQNYKTWLANKKYKASGDAVTKLVLSDPFWASCQLYIDIHKPVYELLRLVDGETPVTGKIYNRMFPIQEQINNSTLVTPAQKRQLYDQFSSRWLTSCCRVPARS